MQEARCLFPFAGNDVGYGSRDLATASSICRMVFRARFVQDVADDEVAVAGVVDAEAQAVIVCRAEFCLNVFQAVVSAVAAAEFEFDPSARDVEFVVDDEDFFGFDFVELCKRGNRLSGTVHERTV